MKDILLVDDEVEIQSLIVHYLRNRGLRVDACNNGRDAGARLKHKKYDLIITDLRMPVEDGFSFIFKTRHQSMVTATTPIIVITGGGETFDFNHGIDSLKKNDIKVLQKPFKPEDLYIAVCEIFGVDPRNGKAFIKTSVNVQ